MINLVSFVDYDSNCVYSAWSLTDDIISPNNVSVLFFSLLVNVLLYHQLKNNLYPLSNKCTNCDIITMATILLF